MFPHDKPWGRAENGTWTFSSRLPHQSPHLPIRVKKLLITFHCCSSWIIDQKFPVKDVEASLPPAFALPRSKECWGDGWHRSQTSPIPTSQSRPGVGPCSSSPGAMLRPHHVTCKLWKGLGAKKIDFELIKLCWRFFFKHIFNPLITSQTKQNGADKHFTTTAFFVGLFFVFFFNYYDFDFYITTGTGGCDVTHWQSTYLLQCKPWVKKQNVYFPYYCFCLV